MPVLPLIDLMLLAGWTSLAIGFVLKVVAAFSHYKPTIFTLSPIDFLAIAVATFLFAIALAARSWVASQVPARSAARRKEETLEAYRALQPAAVGKASDGAAPSAPVSEDASGLAKSAGRVG